MNSKVMWLFVVIALGLGAYGGYAYEKAKFVKLMDAQRYDMQRQIDSAKMVTAQNAMVAKDAVTMGKNAKLGSYLVSTNGMALYTYDKDSKGKSNCTGVCAEKWPPYVVKGTAPLTLPANVGTVKRADGSMQYTWKDMPLYFYAADKDKTDVSGDGVGGVWHVAK